MTLSPQPILYSEYKYILVNTEFTENVVVQSIQMYAVREGLINLKVLKAFSFVIKLNSNEWCK